MLLCARLCCPQRNLNTSVKTTLKSGIKNVLNQCVGRYLLITNSLTCGTLMACGDGIQQKLERYWGVRETSEHDWLRTRRMFVVGLCQGPPQHFFYGALDRFIPSRELRFIALKILIDQLFASPTFLLIFFMGMGLQEGKTVSEILDTYVRKFKSVYMIDWCVWPPSQFINFNFVPPQFRVLYISFITMFYDTFLSFTHHGVD